MLDDPYTGSLVGGVVGTKVGMAALGIYSMANKEFKGVGVGLAAMPAIAGLGGLIGANVVGNDRERKRGASLLEVAKMGGTYGLGYAIGQSLEKELPAGISALVNTEKLVAERGLVNTYGHMADTVAEELTKVAVKPMSLAANMMGNRFPSIAAGLRGLEGEAARLSGLAREAPGWAKGVVLAGVAMEVAEFMVHGAIVASHWAGDGSRHNSTIAANRRRR